ncbi:hypothetical protein Golob_002585 [Gossypium lobatum]|uniref:Uncharacterized protein n=1 Tax=Gossypium lobatum TaxID=34289 RepID=A0A7J8N5E5_9ROSI|nr:hypothetical protein [Gossypium lobatum]
MKERLKTCGTTTIRIGIGRG